MNNQNLNWTKTKIEDICEVLTGGTPRTDTKEYWSGDINWMSSGEVNKRRVNSVEKKITEEGLNNSNARMLPKGTIMMALAGQGKTRGKVAILDIETTCNQSLAGLIVKDKTAIDEEYLFQSLENEYERLRGLSGGEGRSGLNLTLIRNFALFIPPFSTQKKFSSALRSVDDLISATDELLQKISTLKNGLMLQMFGFSDSKVQNKKLVELLDFSQYGLSVKSSNIGQYPMLRMNNFEHGKIIAHPLVYVDLENEEFQEYSLMKGDILFNRTNSQELVGKTGIFELEGNFVFASYLVRLRAKRNLINSHYLNYYMNSPFGKIQIEKMKSRGVSQSNINPTTLRNTFICPVPSLAEQEKIVEILSSVDKKLENEKQRLKNLKLLKKGLMHDIFSQEITI